MCAEPFTRKPAQPQTLVDLQEKLKTAEYAPQWLCPARGPPGSERIDISADVRVHALGSLLRCG